MRLLLMRHANTESPKDGHDFERLLTEHGKLEAKAAAKFLSEHQIDKVLISYAKRTMQTSRIIEEKVTTAESEIVTELYEGDIDMVINLLCNQEDRNKHILVIGHNPLIYDVALTLASPDSDKYEFLKVSMMPTGRVIVLDFPTMHNWHELHASKGHILEIFTPNNTSNG
ncbi:MAG: histidine phosphatase family protein [Rickettsiaceae bacterium]|nr:histidine phosphatase family protein [Rickettsiaceae bacterium]MDP5083045.1 histidine phosphatase family protein [Rickettsiaceae bacterium]